MASIHETAYPRIKSDPSSKDLAEVYTPTLEELQFSEQHTRAPLTKLSILVHLKVFQRLGYFLQIQDTPKPILRNMAHHLGVDELPDDFNRFDASKTRKRHIKLIRQYLGVTSIGDETWALIRQAALNAAATKDETADIINVVLEKLTQGRFELPAFSTIAREAQSARATVNRQCFETVNGLLSDEAKIAIDNLLSTDATGQRSVWDSVKQEPKQPTVSNIRDFIRHLGWLQQLDRYLPEHVLIPPAKIKSFVTEARALNVANMNELAPTKRYALATLLIRAQTSKAFDDIAKIVIMVMQKLHNAANNALKQHQLDRASHVDTLVVTLRDMA